MRDVLKIRANQRVLLMVMALTAALVYIGVNVLRAAALVMVTAVFIVFGRWIRSIMPQANELERMTLRLLSVLSYGCAVIMSISMMAPILERLAELAGTSNQTFFDAWMMAGLILVSYLVWSRLYSSGWRDRQRRRALVVAAFAKVSIVQAYSADFIVTNDVALVPVQQELVRRRIIAALVAFMVLPIGLCALTAAIAPLLGAESFRELLFNLGIQLPLQFVNVWLMQHAIALYHFIWREGGDGYLSRWECEMVEEIL